MRLPEKRTLEMSTSIVTLIQKLQEIKESLGEKSFAKIHVLLKEAEELALRIQQESPEQARRESRHRDLSILKR